MVCGGNGVDLGRVDGRRRCVGSRLALVGGGAGGITRTIHDADKSAWKGKKEKGASREKKRKKKTSQDARVVGGARLEVTGRGRRLLGKGGGGGGPTREAHENWAVLCLLTAAAMPPAAALAFFLSFLEPEPMVERSGELGGRRGPGSGVGVAMR